MWIIHGQIPLHNDIGVWFRVDRACHPSQINWEGDKAEKVTVDIRTVLDLCDPCCDWVNLLSTNFLTGEYNMFFGVYSEKGNKHVKLFVISTLETGFN